MTIQPNEGVSLSLGAKIPGTRMRIRPVNMEFLYGTAFLSESPEAYERLILDAMRGDATLFTRNDEVEAQWRICDPIVVDLGGATRSRCRSTRPVAQGPVEADALLLDGHTLARDLDGRRDGQRRTNDTVWSAQNTTPAEVEAALRHLLVSATPRTTATCRRAC